MEQDDERDEELGDLTETVQVDRSCENNNELERLPYQPDILLHYDQDRDSGSEPTEHACSRNNEPEEFEISMNESTYLLGGKNHNFLHNLCCYCRSLKEYRLIAGLWYGSSKPDMSLFLKPLAETLKILYNKGT